jgi:tetratricopeptide (TPR) repeat protein
MTGHKNRHPLEKLQEALRQRDIQEGFAVLDAPPGIDAQLQPADPNGIPLLLCTAQWVDLGFRNPDFLDRCRARFAATDIANLPFVQALSLRLVDAFRCLSSENLDEAIQLLDVVLLAGENIMQPDMRFIAHFWKGRAHRKKGEYESALFHIEAARRTAEQCTAPKLVAVVKIHESWLIFQRGESRRASQLLDEAEEELVSTGHLLSLGNIESSRGRFVRRYGDYGKALAHFEKAIAIYSAGFADHPNCARALVNAAYVKRLIALDMKAKLNGGSARGSAHARYLSICRDALEMLERAGEIYLLHRHQIGTGTVLVNAGHLHLDSGDIDRAASEARKAFALGEEKRDPILMARARILHSAVEVANADEDLEGQVDVGSHAAAAMQYAEEAVELATHTQNHRLLAAAHIARGNAAAADFSQDWEAAKDDAAKAASLLGSGDRDHLWKELRILRARLLHSIGIDETLKQWSDGQVGKKTFRQIQEEFAEIVIPKVWLSQGRNISRVAEQLSISPKKVRRVLRNVQSHGDK